LMEGNTGTNRDQKQLLFPLAAQSDIVRASQKDQFYRKQLNEQFFDAVNRVIGARLAMKYQTEVHLLSDLAFYALTTVAGNQTLGEEYCDIVQTKDYQIPSILRRFMFVMFHVVIPFALARVSKRSLIAKQNRFTQLATQLEQMQPLIETLQRLHLAIFYFTGSFYDLSKRLVSVKYIFNRKPDSGRLNYNILGVMILLQVLISTGINLRRQFSDLQVESTESKQVEEEVAIDEDDGQGSKDICTLCLSVRKKHYSYQLWSSFLLELYHRMV